MSKGLGAPLLGCGAQHGARTLRAFASPRSLASSGNDLPALCVIYLLEVYGSVLAVQARRRTTIIIIARIEGRGESGHPTGGGGSTLSPGGHRNRGDEP
jgi:hypothetical protein